MECSRAIHSALRSQFAASLTAILGYHSSHFSLCTCEFKRISGIGGQRLIARLAAPAGVVDGHSA